MMSSLRVALVVGIEDRLHQHFLGVVQPGRAGRIVRKHAIQHEPQQNSRQAFDQEEPLPAVHAAKALHAAHDRSRQRAAQDARDRHAEQEQSRHAASALARVPIGQIQDDAGEEACFEYAQQQPDDIELPGLGNKGRRCGGEAP